LLAVRAAIKDQAGLDRTQIGASFNNPLKLSVNRREAAAALLGARAEGYLAPLAAVEAGFRDLKAHELAALDGIKRSANVTALTRGEACVMPAPVFRDLLLANWQVSERLFCLMASRIRELNARFVEQTVLDLRHRLYSELLRLSTPRGERIGERVITPPPFHHIMAARIGCRREQVTREFTMMSQEGLIERTRGALILRQPDVLKARVADAMRTDH